jgi:MFS family permease
VEVFNIRIDEPVTLLTDLLLAGVCFYAFFRIRHRDSSARMKDYFKYYFLTLGLGALFGGLLGHAFLYSLSSPWKLVSWIFILTSVAIMAHALTEMSRPIIKPVVTRMVIGINLLILAAAICYTSWTLAFPAVKYYTIFGMLVVVGSFSYILYRKTGNRGMIMLMLGIGVGLLSAIVYSFGWGLSPWFNHNDISHVILSCSALILYKGAVLILDSPPTLV